MGMVKQRIRASAETALFSFILDFVKIFRTPKMLQPIPLQETNHIFRIFQALKTPAYNNKEKQKNTQSCHFFLFPERSGRIILSGSTIFAPTGE